MSRSESAVDDCRVLDSGSARVRIGIGGKNTDLGDTATEVVSPECKVAVK